MTDKDIYNVSESIQKLLKSDDDLSTVSSKLMKARHNSMNYNLSLNADNSHQFNATTKHNMMKKTMPMGNRLRGVALNAGRSKGGGLMTKAASLLRKGGSAVSAGATAQGASSLLARVGGGISASASGALGMSASMASIAGGPVGIALALAPVLNKIAEE